MVLFRCRLCLLGIAVVLAGAKGIADTPRIADSKAPSPAREEPGRTPTQPAQVSTAPSGEKPLATQSLLSLDLLKLPAGAILVVCEEVREAARLVPKMVVLTPQEYQKLQEQIEQLKHQAEADKTDNPSSCKLTGRVDGDLVYLQAQFGFKTERAKSSINLGCLGAWVTAATLDGSQASLLPGEEGFVLQVDKPGLHQAVVDLQLQVMPGRSSKGADRVFDLNLPRAAITTLEQLDLPAAVPEVRIGSRAVRSTQVEPKRSRLTRVPVVPIGHLSVAWKGPAAKSPKGPPDRAAEGRIIVRVNETHVFTEVELKLQVLSGEASEWRLRLPALPADALLEVKTPPQDEQRVQRIDQPSDKQNPILTIHLHEPSAEPLRVTLHIRQPRPTGPLGVGPFAVLDALTQKGEIEVHAPDVFWLRYPTAGEVSQREVSEEQRSQNVRAVFGYWNMPGSAPSSQPVLPLLSLQVEPIKGAVETQVTQSLRLEGDAGGAIHWQVTTRIEVTPIRTAVDHLEVSLPADFEYDRARGATPAEIVEDVVVDPSKQTAQIKLAHKQILPFALTLVGSYPVPAGQEETSLEFVRPLTWSVEHGVSSGRQYFPVLDRGCQVNVALPDGVEFVARPFRGSAEGKVPESSPAVALAPKSGSRETTWHGERTPPRLALTWRAHRPELPVEALVDVTVAGHQVRVREQLRYQFGALTPSRLLLRVPPEVQQRLKIVKGGIRDAEDSKTPGEWAVSVQAAGKEHTLTLEYSFTLPEAAGTTAAPGQNQQSRIKTSARQFPVPIVKPAQATRGEIKVRVWCDPGERPSLAGGSWTELPTEIVPEQDNLPMLVLRGGHDSQLLLRLTEPHVVPLAAAVAERILVRATVREGGTQAYRVRFLLNKLTARHLDLELPVLLASSDLDVRVDGKRVPLHFVDDSGQETEIGKLLRLQVEPDLYRRSVLLDVNYQVDSGRMEGNGLFQLTLQPPVLRGAILLGRARWQVDLPAGWLPVSPRGGSRVEQRWGWWGWLPAPRPAFSRLELEQWLGGTETPATTEEGEPSLVCWQSALGPLALVQVPQRAWLLVCSLTVLTLGLGLLLAPVSRYLFWFSVAVIGAVVAAIGIFSPPALPVIGYGSVPGALVLLLAVAAQWMLHQRYRRQVIFMPGFTRLKTGSSIVRSGSGNRPRDPSTIDEPPKRPSAVVPGNSGQ